MISARLVAFHLVAWAFAGGLALAAAQSRAADFLIQPSGQATDSSCQSYALAVALAIKRDKDFVVDTAADLRRVETAIRAAIKKEAGAGDVSHTHIVKGFQAYTKDKYQLRMKPVDLAQVGEVVRARSGVSSKSATPPTFALGAVIKDVVLASALKIGPDSYAQGHIFAMLGADGPPSSNQEFLILNSGVKLAPAEPIQCRNGIPDSPGKYTGLLSWRKAGDISYRLDSGGKVLLWTID